MRALAEDITMDASVDQDGALANRAPRSGLSVGRIIVSLVIAPALLVFVAAGIWLLWTLADDAFGAQAASLIVLALLTGSFAVSQLITRDRSGSLVLIAGLATPVCLAFGVAGYALVFGG
jgi:hypothetical protein